MAAARRPAFSPSATLTPKPTVVAAAGSMPLQPASPDDGESRTDWQQGLLPVTLPDEALLAVDAASIRAAQAGQARHSLRLDTLPRLPDTALPRGDLLPNEVLLHLLAPPATMATSSKGSATSTAGRSASPRRRPFRTRFAAAALARGTWPIFENGTRGVRKGREVAVW